MPELQIIGHEGSNFVWVCRIACGEKGVAYHHVHAMPHSPEIDAIHPVGKIPIMRHGDFTLFESRAICAYIDRAFDGPALLPREPTEAARAEQWVSLVMTTIDPIWVRQYLREYIFPTGSEGKPSRAAIDAALPKMAQQFAVLDRAVAETGYLFGDRFTLADIYLVPILFYVATAPEGADLLAKAPKLAAYLERHRARRSVAEAMPTRLPGAGGANLAARR